MKLDVKICLKNTSREKKKYQHCDLYKFVSFRSCFRDIMGLILERYKESNFITMSKYFLTKNISMIDSVQISLY